MELGIDLGTANTVVSHVRRGILFDEPTVMLLRPGGARRERVLAVGHEAADLLGRAPTGLRRGPAAARRGGHRPGDRPDLPALGPAHGRDGGAGARRPRRDRGARSAPPRWSTARSWRPRRRPASAR